MKQWKKLVPILLILAIVTGAWAADPPYENDFAIVDGSVSLNGQIATVTFSTDMMTDCDDPLAGIGIGGGGG